MTLYSQNNTKWQRDDTGHYVEFEQNTQNIDVSVNFENLLLTGEQLISCDIDTTLTVEQRGIFFLDQTTGRFIVGLVVFRNLDTVGIFPVSMTVKTNQNRTYKKHFRVKVV